MIGRARNGFADNLVGEFEPQDDQHPGRDAVVFVLKQERLSFAKGIHHGIVIIRAHDQEFRAFPAQDIE